MFAEVQITDEEQGKVAVLWEVHCSPREIIVTEKERPPSRAIGSVFEIKMIQTAEHWLEILEVYMNHGFHLSQSKPEFLKSFIRCRSFVLTSIWCLSVRRDLYQIQSRKKHKINIKLWIHGVGDFLYNFFTTDW